MSQVPLVSYLHFEPEPHIQAQQCLHCGARYFDRRNACARCGKTEFSPVRVADEGVVKSFTIVHRAAPGIKVPFVSAIITADDGTWVRGNIVDCEPTPEAINLGMRVRFTSFPVDTDSNGTEAVSFGYAPV